ncbi:alpha-amylase family glycosyl hydrolase [Chryseobacterium sp. A301]
MRCFRSFVSLSLFLCLTLIAAQKRAPNYQPKPYVELNTPSWVKNATLYELNVRQFSKEGNFKAVQKALPELKAMGIDILWLMPIHPIGEKNRKGTLGSYYSVKDYYGVNPEFGTKEDFKELVEAIHAQGMHVILDWVANHSSWDNALVTDHPDWYLRNSRGEFQPTPWRDYDDIIDFDYSKPALREYMTKALAYWVEEFDIDGYRCDMASFVPLEFWENARAELEEIKPVFLLAEAQDKELHRHAFDATYAWELYNVLHQIATKHTPIFPLTEGYIAEHVSIFPREAIRLQFTDNHDKNSWEGNQNLNFKKALKASMVLMTTLDGMPLVYNGQEAGLSRSLDFFEKDPISWQAHENRAIYTTLFRLKHQNQALWNGKWGGEMQRITNSKKDHVLSFVREKNGDKVLTVVNLSPTAQNFTLDLREHSGEYENVFEGKKQTLRPNQSLVLEPWAYVVLSQINSKP